MKNQDLFNRTIGILVKAYQNDTLVHSDPCGCAVGNLVAANMGLNISINHETGRATTNGGRRANSSWYDIIDCSFGSPEIDMLNASKATLRQIYSTGYTAIQIGAIEYAFEHYMGRGFEIDKDGYLGLMNVVDTLMTIHEATDTEAEEAKQMFVKVTA